MDADEKIQDLHDEIERLRAIVQPFAAIGAVLAERPIQRDCNQEEVPVAAAAGRAIFPSDLIRAHRIYTGQVEKPSMPSSWYIAASASHVARVAVFDEAHQVVADDFADRRSAEKWIDYQSKTATTEAGSNG